MGSMSLMHWLIVLVVVLLLFGSGKISSIMGDTAKGIKAFKKGMADDDDAAAEPAREPKTIDHQASSSVRSESEKKVG